MEVKNDPRKSDENFWASRLRLFGTPYWIVHAPGKVGRQTFMNSDKDLAMQRPVVLQIRKNYLQGPRKEQ